MSRDHFVEVLPAFSVAYQGDGRFGPWVAGNPLATRRTSTLLLAMPVIGPTEAVTRIQPVIKPSAAMLCDVGCCPNEREPLKR
jgi:hypothetical protein